MRCKVRGIQYFSTREKSYDIHLSCVYLLHTLNTRIRLLMFYKISVTFARAEIDFSFTCVNWYKSESIINTNFHVNSTLI